MNKTVVFKESSQSQVMWGGNSDPTDVLIVGQTYEVEDEEVHSWHTKLKLVGVDGWFNSVSFEDA